VKAASNTGLIGDAAFCASSAGSVVHVGVVVSVSGLSSGAGAVVSIISIGMLVNVGPSSYVDDNVSICGSVVPVRGAAVVLGGVSSIMRGVLSWSRGGGTQSLFVDTCKQSM